MTIQINIETAIDQTIEIIANLSGDPGNVSFYFDDKGNVDYHYYQGVVLTEGYFFSLTQLEYASLDSPEEWGCENQEEVAEMYRNQIESALQEFINQD